MSNATSKTTRSAVSGFPSTPLGLLQTARGRVLLLGGLIALCLVFLFGGDN